MGRELKSVPMDFDYPIDVVWKGYLNPYQPTKCGMCDGSGLNALTKRLSDFWYTHLRTDGGDGWQHHLEQEDVDVLVEAGRLRDFKGHHPTAEEVNDWSRHGFGHDSINQCVCVEAKAKRMGIYGECPLCKGHGHYWCEDKYERLWDEWVPVEPPEGAGYQLWETTTEGSPSSPVFRSLDELCVWCEKNATTFASSKATKDEWRDMLDHDFVHHKEGSCIFL